MCDYIFKYWIILINVSFSQLSVKQKFERSESYVVTGAKSHSFWSEEDYSKVDALEDYVNNVQNRSWNKQKLNSFLTFSGKLTGR
jgi:hypothetical protein